MNKFDACKKKWRETLVGDPEAIAHGDGNVKARVKACGDAAVKTWNELKKRKNGENTVALFRDTPIEVSSDMTREYNTLRRMALGYATYGTECYQSPELLADILFALEFGYTHYYGEAELEGRGWRNIRIFNWWDWQIGTPTALMDTILLVDEHLTVEQKTNYLKIFNFLVQKPRDYGSNKVHYGILMAQSGMLCEKEELIKIGVEGIEDTYLYADGGVNDGQGFYRDGSYIFHTRHPMNFTYGAGHFSAIIELATVLAGSEFELGEEKKELIYTWLYKSFVPFYRNGEIARGVLGRHPLSTRSSGFGLLKNIVSLYEISDGSRKDELSALLKMLVSEHPQFENGRCDDFFATLTLNGYLTYVDAYARQGELKYKRDGMYAFNSMDRAVQHCKEHSFFLSVSSSRVYNYECINHENMDGWYLGDGMLCLENDPLQYDEGYWKNVDKYRLPGTTVDNRERPYVTIAQKNEYLSSRDFVGTLSAGDTGISVMQLESYRSNGELLSRQFYKDSGEYGGPPPEHSSTLTANKAYFFLTGYAVCLGSAINSADGAPVYTVLENRKGRTLIENGKLTGYGRCKVCVNGKSVDVPNEDTVFDGVRYIKVGKGAVCLTEPRPLTVRTTDGTPSFTEVLWQHGVDPKNEKYAYAVLPDGENAEAFCAELPFEVLANDESAQMIKEKASGDVYCVFHSACERYGISVDKELLVCVKKDGIYVCDATQKAKNAVLSVNGRSYIVEFKDNGTVKISI